jgi:hypothetical protein
MQKAKPPAKQGALREWIFKEHLLATAAAAAATQAASS